MEILIIGVTGCKKDVLPKKDNIENELKEEIKDEISLSIIEGTLSKDGVSIILKNNTDKEYTYGPEYSVEKEENGK